MEVIFPKYNNTRVLFHSWKNLNYLSIESVVLTGKIKNRDLPVLTAMPRFEIFP